MATGRPTKYSKALGEQIAVRMAAGESVRKIGEDEDMPAASTIFAWAVDPEHAFSEQYDRARRIRSEQLVEEIVDIADQAAKKGTSVQHARLQTDTRKWFAGKVAPKLYGDKLGLTGADGGDLTIEVRQSGKGERAD